MEAKFSKVRRRFAEKFGESGLVHLTKMQEFYDTVDKPNSPAERLVMTGATTSDIFTRRYPEHAYASKFSGIDINQANIFFKEVSK